MAKKRMPERLNHLFSIISSQPFLNKQGLANEIPFFICHYRPKETVAMEKLRLQLIKKLSKNGIRVLDINLYDLSIIILKERGVWEQILELEETISKEQLKELLQGMLDTQTHLVPSIAKEMAQAEYDVMFLSGVGEVFPYIRSHNVLNNLQSTAKEKPTVMFFPGEYTQSIDSGASLNLFCKLQDDKYYRAFDIDNCQA
jgi:hypothetical protein